MKASKDLTQRIREYIARHNLLTRNETIIIGLSGGPDSLFLLHFLHEHAALYNLTLIAAHLDHGWRANSENDLLFCKQLCQDLKIEFIGKHLNDLEILSPKGSLEEQGRMARRIFFERLAQHYGADKIALGHHFDDQQETFFIRLIRGAGLAGLTSMRAHNDLYIRPLLEISKSDILNSLDNRKISYLSDPTNQSTQFLRNALRMNVLPALQQCDQRFNHNFLQTLNHLAQTEEYLTMQTQELLKEVTTQEGDLLCVPFLAFHPAMHHRVLLAWIMHKKAHFIPTTALTHEIIRFLSGTHGGSHTVHPRWSIHKYKNIASLVKK